MQWQQEQGRGAPRDWGDGSASAHVVPSTEWMLSTNSPEIWELWLNAEGCGNGAPA